MTTGKIQFSAMKKCFVLLLLVFMNCRVYAVPTKQLSYQGRLNNASGQPVPDGTYTIVFSIYNMATGGSPLWTETQNVSVANGGFSVYLGSVTAITLSFNEDYFLGIKVASDPEMTPRLKLSVVGASAYSLEAEKLQGKAASDFALATHTHTGLSATTVNGYSVNATPSANTLLPLDGSAKFPASALPAITDAEISATAAIAKSKLASLSIVDADVSSITASKINTSGATNLVTQIVAGTNVTISPAGGTGVVTINSTPATGFVQLTPSSAQTMQATADVTPLIIKDDTAGTTADLLDVQNNSGASLVKVNGSGNLLVGSPSNVSPKVSVSTSTDIAVAAYNYGTGRGGHFEILNAANGSPGIEGKTNGVGPAIKGWNVGTGPSIYGYTDGMGKGAWFDINNVSNSSALIFGNTTGTGILLQLQTAGANQIVVNNTGNLLVGNPAVTAAKLSAEETGTSNWGAYFKINNASNANAALGANTNGTGYAISAGTTGTATAGRFLVNNASSISAAVWASTNGFGAAVHGDNSGIGPLFAGNNTGTGDLLMLQTNAVNQLVVTNTGNTLIGNPATTTAKLSVEQTAATDNAAYLKTSNASNPNTGLYVTTGGTGYSSYFEISNATNSGDALYARTYGTGRAGQFEINNAANSASLILGTTNGTGNLIQLQQSGVNKFVVGNTGNVTANGSITAFNGANSTPVTSGATQQFIQSGNICDATDGIWNVTFPTAFSGTPTVTMGQTAGLAVAVNMSSKTSTGWSASYGGDAVNGNQCFDWIAIGPK